MNRPAGPAPARGRPAAATPPPAPIDYDRHYRTKDVKPAQLLVDLNYLKKEKRFGDIERALSAYLKYQGKRAEPWMYELLALAFEMNKRPPSSVRTALGWGAFLARKGREAEPMIRVADLMLIRNLHRIELGPDGRGGANAVSVGELLDEASSLEPGRFEPPLMSIKLAEKTTDPKRMIAAVEQVLALGWPGTDELFRTEATRQAEALAKRLDQDGREAEADQVRQALARAEPRDLFVRLTWTGDAGLDLAVTEPLGATATVLEPRTVYGGAIVKSGRGKHPESVYTCPLGFDGKYTIRVETLYNDLKDPVKEATLEVITHEGTPREQKQTHTIKLPKPGPVVVMLQGGRRKTVLPYRAPLSGIVAVPVAPDPARGPKKPATARPRRPEDLLAPASQGGSKPIRTNPPDSRKPKP